MGWRKPSWRKALIWNLSNMLSAFILNLQMPWWRNIYAPKPLKVRNVSLDYLNLLNIKNTTQRSSYVLFSHLPYLTFEEEFVISYSWIFHQSPWPLHSWTLRASNAACLLLEGQKNQCHYEFMRGFCRLNSFLASTLICLRHHWPTFISLLCHLSPPPLCLCNKMLTPSGFQTHLRGNSLQCVDDSQAAGFLCVRSLAEKRSQKRPIWLADG